MTRVGDDGKALRAVAARKIILIGGPALACLEMCRSLGRLGHSVAVLRFDKWSSVADSSRHCKGSLYIGSLEAGVAGWLERLASLLDNGHYTDIVPLDDLAHELLCATQFSLPSGTRLVGPSASAYRVACDRIAVLKLAESVGLRTPRTVQLRRYESAAPIALPCVVRPARAVEIVDDEPAVYSTKVVSDARTLDAKLRDDLTRVDLLLQEPDDGERIDICLGSVEGVLNAISVVRRCDPAGGRLVSEAPTPALLAAACDMVMKLRWTGFIRLECTRLEDTLCLHDVRCGPGDLMAVSYRAGVDLSPIVLNGMCRGSQAPPAISAPGVQVRNLAIYLASRRYLPTGTRRSMSRVRQYQAHRTYLEVERLSDPVPGVAQVVLVAKGLARKVLVRCQAAAWPWHGAATATRGLKPTDSILFVCQGNINRSLVAEHVLRASGFAQVASAGLLGMSGRRPSQQAEDYIRNALGVVGVAPRSRSVYQALARSASFDLVVCFERRQIVELLGRHPQLHGRVTLLSRLCAERGMPVDIPDPHGRSDVEYQFCFDRIHGLLRRAIAEGAADQTIQKPGCITLYRWFCDRHHG